MQRASTPLGAYHVRAMTVAVEPAGWLAHGQTWLASPDGQQILLAEVSAGPRDCEQSALDEAYDRAYSDTLRLILREFACF